MRRDERRRVALFALVCAALIGAALAFGSGGEQLANPAPQPPGGGTATVARSRARVAVERNEMGLEREVRAAARRFLAAFLRYEVGEIGPGVKRTLRHAATPRFAAELLAGPPAPPSGGFPPRVALGPVAVAFVSAIPPRAVISGAARRGGAPEQFSFVFERRRRSWLASAPGQ